MVTKATSSTFTVSKPFFTLSFYDGKQTYEDTFSMYDIENAPTTVSADEITIDGSASSIAKFSNYLDTKSVDGSLKVTWSLGNHSYSKTVKNVYSTSYVIPVSWLDAISDSSQAYGGGKVTVQISYGTKVYTTISTTFNCIVSDTFLPTISSVTLADKTNTPVPASWNKVFVQNQSGIRVSAITCAASQGATVKRIKLRLDTQYTEQTYSASSLPQINRIINSGSLECEVTITDSRGRTCNKTCTVNVLPYDIPKFTLIESDRCNKTGEMDNDGTYFLSQSAVEYSSCTGLNSITITAEYKKTDTSEWLNKKTIKPGSNVLGGELDTEFSYDVRYVLKDAFSTVTYIDYVSTAIYLMHFLHGGRTVTVPLTYWMLQLDGTVKCDISIITANKTVLSTTLFELEVQEAAAPDDSEIEKDDDYGILIQLIADVQAIKDAEAKRVTAENGRVSAEKSRVSAENSRVNAETTRVNAEAARVKAEQARVSAEKSRVDVESKRVTAEKGRVDAESKRVAAETARVQAETKRQQDTSKAITDCNTATDSALKAAATMMIVNDDTGKTYQGAIKVIGGKPVFEYDEVVTG